ISYTLGAGAALPPSTCASVQEAARPASATATAKVPSRFESCSIMTSPFRPRVDGGGHEQPARQAARRDSRGKRGSAVEQAVPRARQLVRSAARQGLPAAAWRCTCAAERTLG